MRDIIMDVKRKFDELRGIREPFDVGLAEDEQYFPHFTAEALIMDGEVNREVSLMHTRILNRISNITLETLIELFDMREYFERRNPSIEMIREDIEAFEQTNEFWGRKFTPEEKIFVLAILKSMELNEKNPEQSKKEYVNDLILTQHYSPDTDEDKFILTIVPKGSSLENIGFPRPLSNTSTGVRLGIWAPILAIQVIVWTAVFLPAAFTFFSNNLFLGLSVLLMVSLFVGMMELGKHIPSLVIIGESNVIFPSKQDGRIHFAFPLGSTVPLIRLFSPEIFFGQIHAGALVTEQIAMRDRYFNERSKTLKLTEALKIERTGRLALHLTSESDRLVKSSESFRDKYEIKPPSLKGVFSILILLLGIVIAIVIFAVAFNIANPTVPEAGLGALIYLIGLLGGMI